MSDETAPTTPVVSVIVPSFKGVRLLPALLDGFAHQSPDTPDFEVIVVIDGVDDGSVALIEAEKRLSVRYILFPENRGRVAALNAGFEQAQGHVLVRCDDDFVPNRTYIRDRADAHRGQPRGIIGLPHNIYEPTPYARTYAKAADRRQREHAASIAADQAWRLWNGNTSITRDIFETVGRFDPEYRLYGWEDVDYGYRVHAAGFPVTIDPTMTVDHRIASVTTVIRSTRAFHSSAARRIFERKHPEVDLDAGRGFHPLWNVAVSALSMVIARTGPGAIAQPVDAIAAKVPAWLATKLIALTVEASGEAGLRVPEAAREVF